MNANEMVRIEAVRIDKWLWAARFFKTRTLASTAVDLGRVLQNNQRVKPAHTIKVGDFLQVQHGDQEWQVLVLQASDVRGSAQLAQMMYQETEESKVKRQQFADNRKYQREPSAALSGRPTKHQRRQLSLEKKRFGD